MKNNYKSMINPLEFFQKQHLIILKKVSLFVFIKFMNLKELMNMDQL